MKHIRLLKNRIIVLVVLLGLLCSSTSVDMAYAMETVEDGYVYVPTLPLPSPWHKPYPH